MFDIFFFVNIKSEHLNWNKRLFVGLRTNHTSIQNPSLCYQKKNDRDEKWRRVQRKCDGAKREMITQRSHTEKMIKRDSGYE